MILAICKRNPDGPAQTLSWNVLTAHYTRRRAAMRRSQRSYRHQQVWRTETVLYVPTQRWTSSGYRGPVNCNSLMLCDLPQISSVHCGLTTVCCCCRTQATNEYCCCQTFQNGPTQHCINRIQTTARVPAGTAVTIQDVNHGCGWGAGA